MTSQSILSLGRLLTLFDLGACAGVTPARLSEYELGRWRLPPHAVERVRAVLEAETAKYTDAARAIA